MRVLLATLLLWLSAACAVAAESEVIDTGRVNAQLVTSHDALAPGQTFDVALVTELDPKWHTYWRNPGDSGEPVYLSLTLPDGGEAGEIVWPVPMPVPTGPIINYGFEGTPVFPMSVVVPDDAQGTFTVEAEAYYLVCYDICVPENASFSLALPVFDAIADPKWSRTIVEARSNSPKAADHRATARMVGDRLHIDIEGVESLGAPYLFPHDNTIIDHSAPQGVLAGDNGIRFDLAPGFGWPDDVSEPFEITLAHDAPGGRRAGRVVTVVPNGAALGLTGLEAAAGAAVVGAGEGIAAPSAGLLGVLLAAFAGGVILNLMPCVFPVISLKALSLARAAHGERAQARVEGWAYTGGVLLTFALLAGLLIALSAGGATLGWGFQLQNPVVVGLLALVVFAIGLNLLGLFEVGGRIQNAGAGLTQTGGSRGAFFTGMLAVVVATPCTAPFMAGAVGYALGQSAPVILATLLALGFGLAAPFLLLAYLPALLARLPRPGPWMETFRQILAFPMLLTAVYLVWVVSNQAGSTGTAIVLLAMLGVGFAVWLARRSWRPAGLLAGVAAFAAVFAIPSFAVSPATSAEFASAAWSAERVAEERALGRAVFVDFTADWCVTCKVNERLVLDTPAGRALFADTDTAFLVADWTRKDDVIAAELARHGRAGVPLYLLYPPGTEAVEPAVLPQVLTRGNLEAALRKAAG